MYSTRSVLNISLSNYKVCRISTTTTNHQSRQQRLVNKRRRKRKKNDEMVCLLSALNKIKEYR